MVRQARLNTPATLHHIIIKGIEKGHIADYNLLHSRFGHLFQNHYKSIVCNEDSYFRGLLRYIHLNPLRAILVNKISELNNYPWCGHAVLMSRIKHEWQDWNYALSWFGKKRRKCKKGL